jgi:hypothetical protein
MLVKNKNKIYHIYVKMDHPRIIYEEDMHYYVSDIQKKINKSPSVSPIQIHTLYEEDYYTVDDKS